MTSTMHEQLGAYLDSLERQDRFAVDAVLKESPHERTERVYLTLPNGGSQGPFIRKTIARESGIGSAYERIWNQQQQGLRTPEMPWIFECLTAGDTLIVIMEYVPGETLQDVVYRCDPSPALALDLFPRICDAVMRLHEEFSPPMIHRDLKPSNILISAGRLTIIDFGIARTYREGEAVDTRHFGTRNYAPPEQFGFGQTDGRSDIYALGMICYYCLTESVPDAARGSVIFEDPRIPAPLRPVLAKATAFDPKERYGSVRELKQAFLDAMAASGFAPAQLSPGSKRSVSETIGLIWNVIVLSAFLSVVLLCATAIVADLPSNGASLPWSKKVGTCFIVFGLGVVAYLLLDKRRLRADIPRLRNVTWRQEVPVCLSLLFLVCLIVAVLGSV